MNIQSSVVVVTGGTGSFGQTMSRELLNKGASEVRIVSRDELKQEQMRTRFSDKRLRFYIGDVRDKDSLKRAFAGANLAFHAAALKQVPSGEFFPMEIVKTNVLGSENVIDTAIQEELDAIVCLSTDKAVYPVNAMGMSKGLMEKVALSRARLSKETGTRVMVTRYGNVMLSRGSVIEKFISQAQEGKALTVTNPNMTRFMMSLQESVDLVMTAWSHGLNGDLFVKKGEAASIGDLANAVGTIINQGNYRLAELGYRHGEKTHETLLSGLEMSRSEDIGGYFRLPIDDNKLDYDSYFDSGVFTEIADDYSSSNARRLNTYELMEKISRALDYENQA